MMVQGMEAVVFTYAWLTRQGSERTAASSPKAPPARPRPVPTTTQG